EQDAGGDGDREAEGDPLQARHDVRPELGEEPHVLEPDEDGREAREVPRLRVRRPELPAREQRHRHRDLGRHLERQVAAAAHVEPTRCDGCHCSPRRSIAEETRWIATPRNPVASAYAYSWSSSPNAWA